MKQKLIQAFQPEVSENSMLIKKAVDNLNITLKSADDFETVSRIIFTWHEDFESPRLVIYKSFNKIKTLDSVIEAIEDFTKFWRKWV